MKKIFDKKTIQIIVKKYMNGESLISLSKKFNVHLRVIKRTLISENIKLRNMSECTRTYHHNEHIFDVIDNHEKAYWVGFLMGDGNITNNIVQISLSSKDIDHLYKFLLFIESNSKVRSYEKDCYFKNCKIPYKSHIKYSMIAISSPLMSKALNNYGVCKNKTFRETVPNINKKFINSFILGFIDADGSWVIDKTRNHKFLHFSLIGNYKILNDIQQILMKKCKVNKTKIIDNKKTPGLGYLRYGGNKQVIRIYKFLYKDSTVYLDRKYNRINNFIKTIEKK